MINQTGYYPAYDPVLGRVFFNTHTLAYYIDREGDVFWLGIEK